VYVVGLTGGIGSGKSALTAVLRGSGLDVVDADQVARRCVESGTPGLAAVVERFGQGVLLPDGSLDRAGLASIVFSDEAARRDLEAITHPCIRAGIDAELAALRGRDEPPRLAVLEHPLLVETGAHRWVDSVVVVEAPIEVRVSRLVTERGMTEAEARSRIAAQADDAQRRAVADHVLVNDGDLDALRTQAHRLLERLSADLGPAGDR
jgi:dephospho-CoA kinase